jgi:hypothetical protein
VLRSFYTYLLVLKVTLFAADTKYSDCNGHTTRHTTSLFLLSSVIPFEPGESSTTKDPCNSGWSMF